MILKDLIKLSKILFFFNNKFFFIFENFFNQNDKIYFIFENFFFNQNDKIYFIIYYFPRFDDRFLIILKKTV